MTEDSEAVPVVKDEIAIYKRLALKRIVRITIQNVHRQWFDIFLEFVITKQYKLLAFQLRFPDSKIHAYLRYRILNAYILTERWIAIPFENLRD